MRKVIPLDVVETIREGLLVLDADLTSLRTAPSARHLLSRERIRSAGL
jgi:hypothetical protein